MTYVDAKLTGNRVLVSERVDGKRFIKRYPAPWNFYQVDDAGKFKSIYGDPLSLRTFESRNEFNQARNIAEVTGELLFESDVKPEFKILEKHYLGKPPPVIHIAFLDIEVDTISSIGWARPDSNPYAPINAVTVHQSWNSNSVTLALCPPTMTMEEATESISHMDDAYVLSDEAELLLVLLDLLEDADVTTGWNSKFFDMPYIIARIRMVLGGEDMERAVDPESKPSEASEPYLKRMCLFGAVPHMRHADRWGSPEPYYYFYGKPHMDYWEVFDEFTFEELHSYKLDFILQTFVGQSKVVYEGTLEQLFRNDFALFCEYNRQDVDGLVALDNKMGFMQLANEMAHICGVRLPDTIGTVVKIEQAMLLELHRQGSYAPDKHKSSSKETVAGARVFQPEAGIYNWVSSYDINSLYPNVIRMLNISPEKIIGQIDLTRTMRKIQKSLASGMSSTEAWHQFTATDEYYLVQEGSTEEITVSFEDGSQSTMPAVELRDIIKESGCSLSANGTMFDLDGRGIIPFCLEKWYNERKEFQAKAEKLEDEMAKILESAPLA